jgi:6-phosphogluconolactonase
VAANYASGVLSVFPLDEGGVIGEAVQVIRLSGRGPVAGRQEGPHAHFFQFDRAGAFGFACDLGSDRIMAYVFDENAREPLSPAPVPWFSSKPGAGPRHGVFSPGGERAYYLNELNSTVDVLAYDGARGAFELRQSLSSLPPGCAVPSTAGAIKISPDGKFLYASNRGYDSIAVFRVRPDSGELDFVEAVPSGGKTPRDFSLDPSGAFLIAANQDSDNLVIFRLDPETGLPKALREYAVPCPACVIFV